MRVQFWLQTVSGRAVRDGLAGERNRFVPPKCFSLWRGLHAAEVPPENENAAVAKMRTNRVRESYLRNLSFFVTA
jgi:hypothetical protein